jgi:hypothetical protein
MPELRPIKMTRRRALAVGAATGLASMLRPSALPAWAAPRRTARPRGFGLDVPGAAFRGGRATGVLRAPRRFDLLGVRGAGVHGAGLEVRTRRTGAAWSPWVSFGHGAGHAPDGGGVHAASDPVWAGGADELELRSARPLGGLRVHFVALGAHAHTRPARPARARAAQAPGTPPAIIGRDVWNGGAVPPRTAPSYGEVQVAFVHHTVSANDYAATDSAGIVLAICKYHRDTNGWNDIGYNFLVDKYGQVFEGRGGGVDAAVIGAHAQGYNRLSTGVAVIGTHDDIGISEPTMASIAQLLGWKLSLHGAPTEGQIVVTSGGGSLNRYASGTPVTLNRIAGHRDGDATACPGNALYAQLETLRARATEHAGPISPQPRLTLTAAQRVVEYGADLEVSGILRGDAGAAVAGAVVAIQKQGARSWVTIARATTEADGTWQSQVAWRRAGTVRARARFPGGAAILSAPTDVALVSVLSVRGPTRRRVRAGSSLLLAGTVHPIQAVVVRVERQARNGQWVRGADVLVKPGTAAFATRIPLRRPALYRLTPRSGTPTAPVIGRTVFVRAVRRRASASGGGASAPAP